MGTAKNGQITAKDISSDSVEITASLSTPQILVMSDNYSGGWKVSAFPNSQSKSYEVMPANGFQIAIPLEAGFHHFLLNYQPMLFTVGLWISSISWVLFFIFLFFSWCDAIGKSSKLKNS